MINTALRIVLLCLLTCGYTYAQTVAKKPVKTFYEKAYLHTDRNAYMAGDTLWFKAYLVDAQTSIPASTSGTLYSELISASAQIIDSHVVKLTAGCGHGDYQLPDTLATGKYYLRAYTNWMRNFGNEYFFYKEISVIRNNAVTSATPEVTIKSTKLLKPQAVISENKSAVRFYPEGGALVNNVVSMIAVKAEDAQGKGHVTSGIIISSAGDTAARFTCDSLGMGMFPFLPLNGLSYHAMVGNVSHVFRLR